MKRRTLQSTTINQVAGVSHILGSMQRSQSQIENLYNKRKKVATRSSPIGYWSKSSTIGWYFGISQDSGKILYTCNHLIIDQLILGSGDLKFSRWGFCLARSFSHLSTKHRINLFSATFSLFNDFLVPPQFACNLS